ncbi:MAG: DUF421 domain-containing protein [Ignavibacteria bacterium]|nr:DUF421 domain-containing protein [Ignavibacteria bacterium]MBI3766636.1 DUF421 domain-containing protein [Ignavibacteriales bacterium]
MTSAILDIVLRSAIVYIVVLVGLRLGGKRHLAQLSVVDLVLILLISNAVQNAMVGNDSSLVGGIVAAVTLFIVNYGVSFLFYRFQKFDRIFEGSPTLLVHDGKVVPEHLSRERITDEELERAIREHGIGRIEDVKNAVMELDGTISVIPREGEEKHIGTFKHRRIKYQRRG